MADIKRLLNKKGWTGRELGQLLLANIANDYRQALEGNFNPTPLISEAEFSKMLRSLTDRVQGHAYNEYYKVFEWLKARPAITNGYYMNGQNDFITLRSYIMQALFAEDVYRYVEQLPAIMTQKQFDELKAERVEAYFKDGEDGEELYSNVFNLVERAISFYLHKLQTEPQKPNPLKAIRKKYVSQPVKSKLILSRYNELMGEGYYTLEDGRRSDEMTSEEWQAALTTPKMAKALEQMRATDGSGTEYTQAIAMQRLTDRARIIFNGGTDEDADKAQHKADYERGLAVPAEWHYYEDPPADLTKWDIIEQELLLELYPADIDGSGDAYSESNFTASMEDFKAEFAELVKAMLADIDKKHFSGSEVKLSALPVEKWLTTLYSWRSLYEADFYGEKEAAEGDAQLFDGNKRALFNGIAILRPSDIISKSRCIDERGYYVEPDIHPAISSHSLEAFFTESEDYAENIATVEDARSGLLANYYYLQGYNKQIDLIIALTDVPELEVFKQDLRGLEDKIQALNDLVPFLYKQIRDTDYRDKELQARKMEVLKDIFPPLDYKSLTIPEENIARAQELVGSFKAFLEQRVEFEDLLCTIPEREDGEGAY